VCVRASGNDGNNDNGESGSSSAGIPAARECLQDRLCCVCIPAPVNTNRLLLSFSSCIGSYYVSWLSTTVHIPQHSWQCQLAVTSSWRSQQHLAFSCSCQRKTAVTAAQQSNSLSASSHYMITAWPAHSLASFLPSNFTLDAPAVS
jgi:hypothetical protein